VIGNPDSFQLKGVLLCERRESEQVYEDYSLRIGRYCRSWRVFLHSGNLISGLTSWSAAPARRPLHLKLELLEGTDMNTDIAKAAEKFKDGPPMNGSVFSPAQKFAIGDALIARAGTRSSNRKGARRLSRPAKNNARLGNSAASSFVKEFFQLLYLRAENYRLRAVRYHLRLEFFILRLEFFILRLKLRYLRWRFDRAGF